MTLYTVRFCDKEFVAHNLKDFARIAVFAKWYLRSQALSTGLQCSIRNNERPVINTTATLVAQPATVSRPQPRYRRSRTSIMRKALRSFLYNVLC